MTLEDYRKECGWSLLEMARQAGIDFNTLKRAMNGERVSPRTAKALAEAISRDLGRNIRFQDIDGLIVGL